MPSVFLATKHVDQQISLVRGATGAMETKTLLFQDALEWVLEKVSAQRQTLE